MGLGVEEGGEKDENKIWKIFILSLIKIIINKVIECNGNFKGKEIIYR